MSEEKTEYKTAPTSYLTVSPIKTRLKPDFNISELVDSIKTYGILEPIIVRRVPGSLEIVAGLRRFKAAKTAGLENVPVVIHEMDDTKAYTIQLIENLHRQDLSEEEKTHALSDYAQRTGLKPKEIAQELNMSYSWVLKYLPDKYKDKKKAEAGEVGGEARAEVYRKSQDFGTQRVAQQISECEVCGRQVHRTRLKIREGKLICPICLGEQLKEKRKARPKPEKIEKPKPLAKKYKLSWKDRRARMTPQKSRMEIELLKKLQELDVPVETDRTFCIRETRPDFYFPTVHKAVYVDGKVHQGKEDRDTSIREKLGRRHRMEVVGVGYDSYSDKERDRLFEQIREEVEA